MVFDKSYRTPATRADIATLNRRIESLESLLREHLVQKEFYTIQEFSNKTGLKSRTIEARCRRGQIAAVKQGRNWLIKASEIDRMNNDANENC